MRPRPVFFVVQDFGLGGTPVVLLRLIKGLDRAEFTPNLVLMNRRGALLDELPRDCEVFDLRKGGRGGFPAAMLRYRRLEQRKRPAIVLSALQNANIMCCLAHIGRRQPPRLVLTEHVSHAPYTNDPKHRMLPFAIRRLYPAADRIIAVSDGLKSEIESSYDLPAARVERIYNPIDVQAVRAASREPLERDLPAGPMILSVGRLADQKAPLDLLEAFSYLPAAHGANLVFVGDGPLRTVLEARARSLGLADRVLIVGSDLNPFRWMARAAVFVSAALFEGFALTIAEAMCVGTPVVATDCPHGPRELLADGRGGELVPPRHPRELALAIGRMLGDAGRRAAFVTEASKRVLDFEQSTVVSQYERLFHALLT